MVAGLAQTGSVPADTFSCDTDDQVLNAPYSARHRITSVERRADGSVKKEEASESVARDSQGRRYRAGESHWTYLDAGKPVVKSEMLYQIVDPVARTDTKWDTTSRQVKVIHWSESASTAGAADPRCQAINAFLNPDQGDHGENLGSRAFGGVAALGTRTAYKVPGEGRNGRPLYAVHEKWYCPELKIVVLETTDDPHSGSWRNELVDIIRGEPDVKQYRPPRDYEVQDVGER